MKKWIWLLMVCLLLSGCGTREVFETVADEMVQSAAAPAREILLDIPQGLVAPVSEADNGAYYLAQGWEMSIQTFSSGDLDRTLRTVTGYSREKLTVIETGSGELIRYDLVWSCTGEEGDRVGRAAVLDDGNYHYVLSVLADSGEAGKWQPVWENLFSSYGLA